MKLPPKKRPGNPVLASDWNTLVDALAARTPHPSEGLELCFTPGGFIYRVRRGAAASVPVLPLVLVGAEDNRVMVTPGYVNASVPTLDDTALDANPRPTLAVTSTIAVWIRLEATFATPDEYTVTIGSGSGPPDPEITPYGFSSSWLLGYARLADGAVVVDRVFHGGNLQCDSFGTLVHWWKV